MSEQTRFFAKVDTTGGPWACWMWTAKRNDAGYGQFWPTDGRGVFAHRWAYEYVHGPIPAGLVIDHLCRNPACVNPWHLEAVTFRENVLRGMSPAAVGARRDHCVNGHPFSPENIRVNEKGHRRCRACELMWSRARTLRVKGRPAEVAPKDKTECKNGHPFTPENTRFRKDGGRACRTCAREATARHRARSKGGRP